MKRNSMATGVQRGFTLIEVLIVVTIVAVLASLALPSYNSYVMRGRIPEAISGLSTARVLMEQYFQDNRTYVGAPLCTTAQNGTNFTILAGGCSASGYLLTATGINSMAAFSYTVDQANNQASSVTGLSSSWNGSWNCWVRNAGGQC